MRFVNPKYFKPNLTITKKDVNPSDIFDESVIDFVIK